MPPSTLFTRSRDTGGSTHRAETGAQVDFSHIDHAFVSANRVVNAIADVSLSVAAGEFVALVGPSGCGKTTLLNMVAGLVQPTFGSVTIDANTVKAPSRDVAYMFARDALLPWRTAIQNVELGLQVRGVGRQPRRTTAADWMRRVHLAGFEDSRITQLSQGMRQRVAIARTLSLSPRCILMDEPFAALDAQTRRHIQQEFVELWEQQRPTVLFVTHDLGEAISLSDRVVLLGSRPGRVRRDVAIDLPRPRNLSTIHADPRWIELHDELSEALRVETESSLAAGGDPS